MLVAFADTVTGMPVDSKRALTPEPRAVVHVASEYSAIVTVSALETPITLVALSRDGEAGRVDVKVGGVGGVWSLTYVVSRVQPADRLPAESVVTP